MMSFTSLVDQKLVSESTRDKSILHSTSLFFPFSILRKVNFHIKLLNAIKKVELDLTCLSSEYNFDK
jgi:hypothetical protein